MNVEYKYSTEGVDWDALSEVYRRAPLGNKTSSELEKAFANSMFKCVVWDDGNVVGAGRALADGVDCSYICDIALLPEYQGKGIGGNVISYLVEQSKGHKKIILYSVPGREKFYEKFSFLRMNTAMAIFKDKENAINVGLVSAA